MNHHLQLNILATIARSAPDFKFDQLHGAGHTTFSHYYEFLPFDGNRVWASVHIGSKVEIKSLRKKYLWKVFSHNCCILNEVHPNHWAHWILLS